MSDFYVSEAPERPEPRNLGERTDRFLEIMANPSVFGGTPSRAQRYEAEVRRLELADPPAQSLGDEMVMLAASLAFPAARALPYAIRMGSQGIASIRALSGQAEQAANAIVQSFRNRLGRDPLVQELVQSLGLARDVGVNRAEGLGNPFEGRTPAQVDRLLRHKGFDVRGDDPARGKGGYVNPTTDRSYHIDPYPRIGPRGNTEYPHVDVNRLRSYRGDLRKRKYRLGDKLHDE